MANLFTGLTVLDLSDGIAGPIATMMLADRGADVIRIERPDAEPSPPLAGERVWHRGKRSARLDPADAADREVLLGLARRADVVVESFAPGRAEELGLDWASLSGLSPRLIQASITGYGRDTAHADRPAIDALVAARTGLQWECRGWYGSPMERILGLDRDEPEVRVPESVRIGSDRDGPIFTATPAPSIIGAYQLLLGISAALRARQQTGRGQWVDTSLLQGVILSSGSNWQRPERVDGPGYSPYPVSERRQTWGLLEAKDGFVCTWASPPRWFTVAGSGDTLRVPETSEVVARGAGMQQMEDRLAALAEAAPILKKFTVDQWVRIAAESGEVSCQPVRTPEQALCDPILFAEGSVTEVVDPELGPLRQLGAPYRMHDRPIEVRGPAPEPGAHTDEIRAEAARAVEAPPLAAGAMADAVTASGPLAGIRVLDFGGAVAGPWASQLLADMGADVIKVDAPTPLAGFLRTHMGIAVNRGKRWIGVNAKTNEGAAIVRQLVDGADVVVHNMRPQAAEKLGLDWETLHRLNPRLVFCHTRGFEDGPRSLLPGNDQTGNSLGGSCFEDGGCWDGGRPWFGSASNGDLGNGYLAAIAIVQALYDREHTGKGQRVDASIVNASLVNNSRVFTTPEGREFERAKLDAEQTGLSALYRLYRCRDEWLCLAVLRDAHWEALCRAVPALDGDERFSSGALRGANDAALAAVLADAFAAETAGHWQERLDAAGVPCEISSPTFSRELFEDEDLFRRGWLVRFEGDPLIGDVDMYGTGFGFSHTPAAPERRPIPMMWQDTREVLAELGYDETQVEGLAEAGAVVVPESAGAA